MIQRALLDLDDAALVRTAQEARPGDGRAFSELVRRHEGHVRANCRYIVGSEVEAEDLAQDVFLKAYFNIASFQRRSQFGTWVRRIKVNHCLNHLDARGRRVLMDVEAPSVSSSAAVQVDPVAPRSLEVADHKRAVDAVLIQMNDTLRVPLVLRDMDGLSYEEVAETLGISLSAAKMRIKRGREAFRELWAVSDHGDLQ